MNIGNQGAVSARAFSWRRAVRWALGSLALVGVVALAHCSGVGGAGDRCNPNQASDVCNGGLTCTTNSCGVSVCCPAVIDSSSPPECQPVQPDCPVDGGTAGSGGAGGSDGTGGAGGSGGSAGAAGNAGASGNAGAGGA